MRAGPFPEGNNMKVRIVFETGTHLTRIGHFLPEVLVLAEINWGGAPAVVESTFKAFIE